MKGICFFLFLFFVYRYKVLINIYDIIVIYNFLLFFIEVLRVFDFFTDQTLSSLIHFFFFNFE